VLSNSGYSATKMRNLNNYYSSTVCYLYSIKCCQIVVALCSVALLTLHFAAYQNLNKLLFIVVFDRQHCSHFGRTLSGEQQNYHNEWMV